MHRVLLRVVEHLQDWVLCWVQDLDDGTFHKIYILASLVHFVAFTCLKRWVLRPFLANIVS